jgi:hypothetical protein
MPLICLQGVVETGFLYLFFTAMWHTRRDFFEVSVNLPSSYCHNINQIHSRFTACPSVTRMSMNLKNCQELSLLETLLTPACLQPGYRDWTRLLWLSLHVLETAVLETLFAVWILWTICNLKKKSIPYYIGGLGAFILLTLRFFVMKF